MGTERRHKKLLDDGDKELSPVVKKKMMCTGFNIVRKEGVSGCVSVLQREPLTEQEFNNFTDWLEHQLKGPVEKWLGGKKIQICDGNIFLSFRNKDRPFFRIELDKEESGFKRKKKGKEESCER